MARKKVKHDEQFYKSLNVCAHDALCRMEAAGLIKPEAEDSYESTGWFKQGPYLHEYNRHGFTGNIRAANY